MQKRILTIIVIILAVAIIALGGLFLYLQKTQTPATNVQSSTNVQTQTQNVVEPKTSQPYIKITSPVGGEVWKIGQPHTISWTYEGIKDDTQVFLYIMNYGYVADYGVTTKACFPYQGGPTVLISKKEITVDDSTFLCTGTGGKMEAYISSYPGQLDPPSQYSSHFFTITK